MLATRVREVRLLSHVRSTVLVVCVTMLAIRCAGSPTESSTSTQQTGPRRPASSSAEANPEGNGPRHVAADVRRRERASRPSGPSRSHPPASRPDSPPRPDGRILYSEFWVGKVRVIRANGSVDPKPWADVSKIFGIRWTRFYHGGLSGIAFDPEYATNRYRLRRHADAEQAQRVTGSEPHRALQGGERPRHRTQGALPNSREGLRQCVQPRLRPRRDALHPLGIPRDRSPEGRGSAHRSPRQDPARHSRRRAPRRQPVRRGRAPRVWADRIQERLRPRLLPGRRISRSLARAAPRLTTRSTSSCPATTTAIPTTRAPRPRRVSPRHSSTTARTAHRPSGSSTTPVARYPALRDHFLMCENHGRG